MAQLHKGGKFIFGLSVIHPDLTIQFPPQALSKYDAVRDGKVIIFTGSKSYRFAAVILPLQWEQKDHCWKKPITFKGT